MKNIRTSLKATIAAVVGVALAFGGVTAIAQVQSAEAAATPFSCTTDIYQASAGNMYKYSVPTNSYTLMSGSTNVASLNAIGYNTGDNYIYGLSSGKLYRIASDGSNSGPTTLTGVTPSATGGDFIADNELLTVNTSGVWTLVNTTTDVVTSYASAGATWKAYDFAFDPATSTGYGMNGTTLYIGQITGNTVTVTTKTVTGSLAGATDAWGAAYVDSAGDGYFFDNVTFDLDEMSAAQLASATPAATSITQANSLSTPNDGASCPTASSPLAPNVTTTASTSVTSNAAVLNGTVATGIPAGSDVPAGDITICYSTSSTVTAGALSVSPVCSTATPASLAANTAATPVSLSVSGLSPSTTYYVQVQATNSDGLQAYGNVVSMTTSVAPNATVSFNDNAGSGAMADEVHNAPTALNANTITRSGYTFAGWSTTADGTGTAYADGATYPFASSTTLYAQWAAIPNKTVTFAGNAGTGSMPSESDNVATPLDTNTFTRAGYTFSGWNTAADGSGTSYADAASYPFTADATLYAQWTAIPNKTVTFNDNNGVGTMANESHNVPTVLNSNIVTRAGYTFAGWNTAANGTGTSYADAATYPFASDATLYAQWTAIPDATVTFADNNGVGTMADETENVPTALTANSITRAGYTFAGWNTAADGTGTGYADAATYDFASNATLYAQWTATPNKTVTFADNNGTGTMANEVANVPSALTTNSITRAGYSFAGWNTAADGSGTGYADAASYPFTSSATLYAQWTALPDATVTFNHTSGSGTMADEVANVPTALTDNSFTRSGYTFADWNTAADGTGTSYADAATYAFSANATLYAQWTAIANKTVTFADNNGTGTMASQSDDVPTALNSNTLTRAGYTFAGWNTAADGTGTAFADAATYPFASSATLYAQWTAIPDQTVTFNKNLGSGTMAAESDNVPTALTDNSFTRAGYTFGGWNTAADGTGTAFADAASFPFTSSATLYAQWTAAANKTVTFDNNNGAGTMANEVDNVPTALTDNSFARTGYTFGGWNTAADGSGTAYANAASYPFSADATLFAQWVAVGSKTVTFDNNNGAGTMANESKNVPTALTSNSFTRAGYTFGGWNTAADGTGTAYANSASFPFTADATLYAQWTAIPNKTVTFNNNNGSGTMASEAKNVPTALTSNSFTRVGYTFGGWNTTADGSGTAYADAASFPFSSNATLYAQWTATASKTVTFDNNLGSGTMPDEVKNVATALTTHTFTRSGYTFAGWNTAADGSGTSYADAASFPFTSDATLYAQWSVATSNTLTFNVNGGSGSVAPVSGTGTTTIPTTVPKRAGYTFASWNTAADGSGTTFDPGDSYSLAAGGVLYAQWTKAVLGFTGVDTAPGLMLAMILLLLGCAATIAVAVMSRRRGRGAARHSAAA